MYDDQDSVSIVVSNPVQVRLKITIDLSAYDWGKIKEQIEMNHSGALNTVYWAITHALDELTQNKKVKIPLAPEDGMQG